MSMLDRDAALKAVLEHRRTRDDCSCSRCVETDVQLVLEQRAQEAERCAKTYSCFDVDGRSYLIRAVSLRSQIGGRP